MTLFCYHRPSMHGLQRRLNTCHKTIVELGFVFNCLKSYCTCFDPQWKCNISPMQLGTLVTSILILIGLRVLIILVSVFVLIDP
jgi:hypothetical protein